MTMPAAAPVQKQQGLNQVVINKVRRMVEGRQPDVMATITRLLEEGKIAQDYMAPIGVSRRNSIRLDDNTPIYWMDFGNARTTGQVLVGTVRNKIYQPVSEQYQPTPYLNVITEEVSYSKIDEKDSGPSCSLAEALEKQDLFINSILAQAGCGLLWKMIREGRTFYRGIYLNLDTMRMTAVPV